MSKHTPEPWYAIGPLTDEESGVAGGTPAEIGVASDEPGDAPIVICECFNEADRDRAVACVNALAGIDDPAAFVKAAKACIEVCRKLVATGEVKP